MLKTYPCISCEQPVRDWKWVTKYTMCVDCLINPTRQYLTNPDIPFPTSPPPDELEQNYQAGFNDGYVIGVEQTVSRYESREEC